MFIIWTILHLKTDLILLLINLLLSYLSNKQRYDPIEFNITREETPGHIIVSHEDKTKTHENNK